MRIPALAGMVYQHVEGEKHIRDYANSLHSVYKALDDEDAGGEGHGARLAKMGVGAIRIYELPVENQDDVNRAKEIFRRLYTRYRIKVLAGDWAGLHTGMNFNNAEAVAALGARVEKLAALYGYEPWVLGWQLGNENNYHLNNGALGQEIGLDPPQYYALMDDLAGRLKKALARRQLAQFVSLGQGDLTPEEAKLMGRMKNFDAVGINCYRKDPNGFEELILMAAGQIRLPIYFAEVGEPADNRGAEEQQSQYLQQVLVAIFSHAAGRNRSGTVLGAFVHEATDEAWKRNDRGEDGDSHFGIFGKPAEAALGQLLIQNRDFSTWVLPTNDAPDTLILSAWKCLEGPYVRKYSRDYGYAMAWAGRAITLYQDSAQSEQLKLVKTNAPIERSANSNYWALNAVGAGYFIIGNCWMLLSYDFKGAQPPAGLWPRFLEAADATPPPAAPPAAGAPTNAPACVRYARQIFSALRRDFPYAHLQDRDGKYHRLDRVIEARFPELSRPYIALTWKNAFLFTGICLGATLGFAKVSQWAAARACPVKTEVVMGPGTRFLFILALALNFGCLFWFGSWWVHPVRARYFTVQPQMYLALSVIGALGMFFYFYIWHVLWNMRRPAPMEAPDGLRVAVVTTRVASEPVESLGPTLQKMAGINYPHDSYLLDEEDSDKAKAACAAHHVFHFSRRGNPKYNEPSGKFQARTKGGNLNSWLYEHGKGYDFVAFLDPDHAPRPEFLHKVLGYFSNPKVGFVQGPQVFSNRSANWIARGASEQSYFFYGPMQMGLFGIGACVVNGSHSTFRVSDLLALKGNSYAVHDADDILTSIRFHARGKSGVYVPDIIAEGLAPETWDDFSKQQRRWAYSMFHLLFYFYIPELIRTPWRCKLAYLLFALFYIRGVAFAGLLMMPFVSVITGNPPVNADMVGFCLRYLPFFAVHYGILLLIGQRYLISGGSRKGFWYRAGLLWVAMWWDHLCALVKALRTRRVKDRVVAAKWKAAAGNSWGAVRPHLFLTVAGIAAIAATCAQPERRETIWGTLPFLGLIVLSQGVIAVRIIAMQDAPPPSATAL